MLLCWCSSLSTAYELLDQDQEQRVVRRFVLAVVPPRSGIARRCNAEVSDDLGSGTSGRRTRTAASSSRCGHRPCGLSLSLFVVCDSYAI
jgi:hypothetical protein